MGGYLEAADCSGVLLLLAARCARGRVWTWVSEGIEFCFCLDKPACYTYRKMPVMMLTRKVSTWETTSMTLEVESIETYPPPLSQPGFAGSGLGRHRPGASCLEGTNEVSE